MSVPAEKFRLFISFVFHSKTNILYLFPQAPIKMKITASSDGAWKGFVYCTGDHCFKIDLYNFLWPEHTPVLQQS
jgi:hypothetical protein